jgi:isoleucyl-tRNA synthetase
MKVKAEASREMDRLRKDGTLGNSLEAEVTLFTDNKELKDFQKKYEGSLTMALIVSEVILTDKKPANVVQGIDIPELFVSVAKSRYQKCERCWNYRKAVGKDSSHPTLCDRCIPVVS